MPKPPQVGSHQIFRLFKGQKTIDPFIDTVYFDQPQGNTQIGERQIDAQTWSSTEYVGKTMRNDETIFGVNFVDGRIKGYPKYNPRTQEPNKMYFRFVRENEADFPQYFGPQGDVRYVFNYFRCVRSTNQ